MDSWPVAERARTTESLARKRKRKVPVLGYPQVDAGAGGPNLVTLVERDGRFEWTSLVTDDSNRSQLNRLHTSKLTTIFPATRPPPDIPVKSTILQSAERGANFIRTYFPDVNVAADLIRDELSQDAQTMGQLQKFDPYIGNLLHSIVVDDQAFLVFPMGELNRDLNISPFRDTDDGVVFKPSAHPIRIFDTPIQQIATTPPGMQTACLGVRTYGQTSFLKVDTSRTMPCLDEVAALSHEDTGERVVADVTLSTEPFSSLVVNDCGSVYRCNIADGGKIVDLIHPAAEAEGNQDPFWRLARGIEDTNYFLASQRSLSLIDVRSNESINLFSLTEQDVVTSVEDQGTDNIVKLCTTSELVWIDARFSRRPLLAYKHGRQYDRYLETRTSPLSSAVTLLTSRFNSMVTLYDVSRSEDHQLIHINSPSYCLFSDDDVDASYAGTTVFRYPSLHENTNAFSLIRLTERGSLHKVDLSASVEGGDCFSVDWNADVKELETQPLCFQPPYAEQAFVETDLSVAYDHIFCVHEQEREQREDEDADAVYNLLESIPTFWQGLDAPVEHIITTHDAVLRAGDEPTQTSRADFLTDGVINSTRGYRALIQDRLSPSVLAKGSSWHKNLTPTLQRLDPTFPEDAQSGAEAFERYDLAPNPERSFHSLRYEKLAREQLALDLALSADIFSSQPFLRASNGDPALEDLTRTLSLGSEPPPVDFGYLQPKATDHYKKDETDDSGISMGVRSLLKNWQIGADPEKYVFVDPYDGTPQTTAQFKQEAEVPFGKVKLQRPPAILAATAVPLPRPPAPELGRRVGAQSQPDLVGGGRVPSRGFGFGSQIPLSSQPQTQSSEEYMMNTQILPGAYGGRPTLPKKKATKKRVGGF